MYELFEHTADLGLRVRAPDLATLLAEAAMALFAAILDEPGSVEPRLQVEVRLPPDEVAFLLFDWLKELLHHFDSEHLVFGRFEARVGEDGLHGAAWGERVDPARHALAHEVKAITYHQLRVEREGNGWLAELIVDI